MNSRPPRCSCPKRCGYIDIDWLEWFCTDDPRSKCHALTKEDVKRAYAQWRFDFDDSQTDGRPIKRLESWEEL